MDSDQDQNQDEEVMEQNIDPSELQIPSETVKLDIFQHMRIGIKNKDVNCLCENDLESLYYCIPCKVSCCPKCSLQDHYTHLLLQKEKYTLKPPQIEHSFSSVENMLEKDENFSVTAFKGDHYVSGYLKKLCPSVTVFIAFSFQFFRTANSFFEMDIAQNVLTDLCRKLFVRYASWIMTVDTFYGKVIHLLFVPEKCFDERFKNKCEGDFLTCSVNQANSTVSIRYSVNIEHFFVQLKNALDRSIENQFFLDLMKPFQTDYPEQYNELMKLLQADQNKKKTVSVNETKLSFVFSPLSCNIQISDISLMKVKNELAAMCKQFNIQPGEYHKIDVQMIIRQIQEKIIPVYETKVAEFDQLDLHKKLLDYYAFQLLGIHIHWDRYHSLGDLDQDVREDFERETIKAREDNRNHKLTAEYLIETNLFVKHIDNPKKITDREYNYLLAFSYWLRELQEISDICYHCPTADSFLPFNS